MDGTVLVSLAALLALTVAFAISHKTPIKARLRRDGLDINAAREEPPG